MRVRFGLDRCVFVFPGEQIDLLRGSLHEESASSPTQKEH